MEISSKEDPFDVFICYKQSDENGQKTTDAIDAMTIYHHLTNEGYKTFFAEITLAGKPGQAYEPYIFAALNSAKVMLVVGSKPEYFNAPWVKNEWSRFLALIKPNDKKALFPIYKNMDPYDLPDAFSQLQAMKMEGPSFIHDLLGGVKNVIGKNKAGSGKSAGAAQSTVDSLLKRAQIFMENADWKSANSYCEKVLDADPTNGEAYRLKLLAGIHTVKEEDILHLVEEGMDVWPAYKNLLRYADAETAARFKRYNDTIKKRAADRRENARQLEEVKEQIADTQIQLEHLTDRRNIDVYKLANAKKTYVRHISLSEVVKSALLVLGVPVAAVVAVLLAVNVTVDVDNILISGFGTMILLLFALSSPVLLIITYVGMLSSLERTKWWLILLVVTLGVFGIVDAIVALIKCATGGYRISDSTFDPVRAELKELEPKIQATQFKLTQLQEQQRRLELM